MSMSIFPPVALSEEENTSVVEVFNMPVVRKYLHGIANDIGAQVAIAIPSDDIPAEIHIRKEMHVKGQLAMLDQLLSLS